MVSVVSGHWQRCGSCEYWTGPREPRSSGDIEFVNSSDSGKCIGTWKGRIYMQNHSCSGWKRWGVLP